MRPELKRLLALERIRNLAVLEKLMRLHPWDEVLPQFAGHIKAGHRVYQQFNCAKCGAKQTMDIANTMFEHGICEQCGHDTNIKKDGMNYMLHVGLR